MAKRSIRPFRPVYPTPAGLITAADADGKANIITLGEVYNLSIATPVIVGVGIVKQRYTHRLISESGEFVVNFPTTQILAEVDRCGCVSGRQVDKFAAFGLTAVPATRVRPPLIAECPINLECRLIGIEAIGDHDLFRGEVLAQHADEDILDEAGKIRVEKLDPICYMLGEYWSLGAQLGRHGFTQAAE